MGQSDQWFKNLVVLTANEYSSMFENKLLIPKVNLRDPLNADFVFFVNALQKMGGLLKNYLKYFGFLYARMRKVYAKASKKTFSKGLSLCMWKMIFFM